jgi:cell division transport system permease protein
MKLVGASSFSIQLPFLLESVFAAVFGWMVALGMLSGFKVLIDQRVAPLLSFTRFFGWDAVWIASLQLLGVGLFVAALASVITLRRFVKV